MTNDQIKDFFSRVNIEMVCIEQPPYENCRYLLTFSLDGEVLKEVLLGTVRQPGFDEVEPSYKPSFDKSHYEY